MDSGGGSFFRDPFFFFDTMPQFVYDNGDLHHAGRESWHETERTVQSLEERREEPKLPKNQVSYVKGMIARSRHKRNAPPIFHSKSA